MLTLLGSVGATAVVGGALHALAADSVYLLIIMNPSATATLVPTDVATQTPGAPTTPTPTATAVGTATATPVPSCIVCPEKTVGPYFVDEMLNRSDIRSDPSTGAVKSGVQLDLKFVVSKIASNSYNSLYPRMVRVTRLRLRLG